MFDPVTPGAVEAVTPEVGSASMGLTPGAVTPESGESQV